MVPTPGNRAEDFNWYFCKLVRHALVHVLNNSKMVTTELGFDSLTTENTRLRQKFRNIFCINYFVARGFISWSKQFKLWSVPVVDGSIILVGALTCCALLQPVYDLKSAQRNVQKGPIQALMLYKFELGIKQRQQGGARGVVVIVVGNEHGGTSSNPGRDWLHFT